MHHRGHVSSSYMYPPPPDMTHTQAERESAVQHRGQLAVSEQALARAETQLAELRGEKERLETNCSRLDVERESAVNQGSQARLFISVSKMISLNVIALFGVGNVICKQGVENVTYEPSLL